MESQDWAAAFAGVSAFAAVLTAAIAAWSLAGSRKDSHDRSRPIVTASLRIGPRYSHGTTYLVVRNGGLSVARHVRVTFKPELPEYETTDDGQPGIVAPVLRKRYSEPIPVLAPGESLNNVYSYIAAGINGNVEPVPDRFTVLVEYRDDRRRAYRDEFQLDRSSLGLQTNTNPGDGKDADKRRNVAIEALAWEAWQASS